MFPFHNLKHYFVDSSMMGEYTMSEYKMFLAFQHTSTPYKPSSSRKIASQENNHDNLSYKHSSLYRKFTMKVVSHSTYIFQMVMEEYLVYIQYNTITYIGYIGYLSKIHIHSYKRNSFVCFCDAVPHIFLLLAHTDNKFSSLWFLRFQVLVYLYLYNVIMYV